MIIFPNIQPLGRRFIVHAMEGYDFGAASRGIGVIGEFDSESEARDFVNSYREHSIPSNTGASYRFAKAYDQETLTEVAP